jgi:hypothetical protein
MLIDLKKIPTCWITHPKSLDYKKSMQFLIEKIGFETIIEINGESIDKNGLSFIEIQQKKTNSVAEAHIKALKTFEPPFLILEDDCAIVETNFKTNIDLPKCDALYLGTHQYGMVRNVSTMGGTISSIYDESYLRVYNMLGIHAILYITKEYVNSTINTLQECISISRYCDECVALNLKNHTVLSVKKPFFYQKDGHNDSLTQILLNPYF